MNWVTQTGLVRRLSKQVRLELKKFFVAAAERQSKTRECFGRRGPKSALQWIKSSGRKFQAASEKQAPYSARCRLVLGGNQRLLQRSGMGAANFWQSFS